MLCTDKKMKNALEQTREKSRMVLEAIEKMTEDEVALAQSKMMEEEKKCDTKMDVIIHEATKKTGNSPIMIELLEKLNRDLWAILEAKAEGEAEEKG